MDNFELNRETKSDNMDEIISEKMGISKESIPKSAWLKRVLYSFLISASTFGTEAVAQNSADSTKEDTWNKMEISVNGKTIETREEGNKPAYEAADSLIQILKEKGKLVSHPDRPNEYVWANGKVTIKTKEENGKTYQYIEINYSGSGAKYFRSIHWNDKDQDGHVSQDDIFLYAKTEGLGIDAPGTLVVLEKEGELRAFSGEGVSTGDEYWPLPPDGSKTLALNQVVALLESQIDLSN